MKRKGEVGFGVLILMFVGIILGLALIGQVIDTQNLVTQKQSVTNQSVDTSSAWIDGDTVNTSKVFTIYSQSDWKTIECPLSSVTLKNVSEGALTATTDYVLNSTHGTFTLVNTTKTTNSNTTYVDYSYCEDGYNTSQGSRGIANLWSLFSALIILSVAIVGIREWLK